MKNLCIWLIVISAVALQIRGSGPAQSPATDPPKPRSEQPGEADYYREDFLPLDQMSWVGLVVLAVMLSIATMGGVGGNVVILPVCLIFFKFNPKVAIAHTAFFSAVGSITRVLYEKLQGCMTTKKSKKSKKKLPNYHLVMLSAPPAILGSFFGANANKLSPEILIMGTALVIQIALLWYSFRQYCKQRSLELMQAREEREESKDEEDDKAAHLRRSHLREEDSKNQATYALLTDASPTSFGPAISSYDLSPTREDKTLDAFSPTMLTGNYNKSLYASLRDIEEGRKVKQTKLKLVDGCFLIIFMALSPTFEYLRGTKTIKSIIGNQICTDNDFYLLGGYVAVLLLFSLMIREIILRRNKGIEQDSNSVEISAGYSSKFMIAMFFVSLVGGFVSSGASTLITMTIIAFGISPFSASSTGLVVVIIFSGSSATIYYLNGFIYYHCALIGSAVVVLSTLITRMTVYQYFLKHGKASVILLFISLMMLITIPSNLLQVAPHIKSEYDKGKNIFAFDSFCK